MFIRKISWITIILVKKIWHMILTSSNTKWRRFGIDWLVLPQWQSLHTLVPGPSTCGQEEVAIEPPWMSDASLCSHMGACPVYVTMAECWHASTGSVLLSKAPPVVLAFKIPVSMKAAHVSQRDLIWETLFKGDKRSPCFSWPSGRPWWVEREVWSTSPPPVNCQHLKQSNSLCLLCAVQPTVTW